MRDHPPINLSSFKGLFCDGPDATCPKEYQTVAHNLRYENGELQTRYGLNTHIAIAGAPIIIRTHIYRKAGVDRVIVATAANELYDTTVSLALPIFSDAGAAWTDFSLCNFYDRCYITFHNRELGDNGRNVYMYDGTNFRLAAGARPTGAAGVTIVNGSVFTKTDAGNRLWAVSAEIDTGFITAPGPMVATVFTPTLFAHDGAHKASLSVIPVGPTGTTKRHILVTKRILSYSGNPLDYEYFFVAEVAGNVTTVLADVDFYDSELVDSADYLFDLFETIPGGVFITNYQNRMLVGGEYANKNIIRVSLPGDVESFNSADGFILVDPQEYGGVKNATEFHNSLYIYKSSRSYITQDNGDVPTTWPLVSLTKGIGTECFGIAQILGVPNSSVDSIIFADKSGLILFDGANTINLTKNVKNVWTSITRSSFNKTQIIIDPINKEIYIFSIFTYTVRSVVIQLLFGDISDGITPDDIKWSTWKFSSASTMSGINAITSSGDSLPIFIIGKGIYKLVAARYNDYDVYAAGNTAYPSSFATALITAHGERGVGHYNYLRVRALGSGTITLSYWTEGGTEVSLGTITLASTYDDLDKLLNIVKGSIIFSGTNVTVDKYFKVNRLLLFGQQIWESKPL